MHISQTAYKLFFIKDMTILLAGAGFSPYRCQQKPNFYLEKTSPHSTALFAYFSCGSQAAL
jgi:hypothetical protein